jgi:hypothetical protein
MRVCFFPVLRRARLTRHRFYAVTVPLASPTVHQSRTPRSFQFRLMQPVRHVGCDAFIRQGSMLSCMLMRTCVPLAVQQDGSATGIIQAKAPRTWQNQQSSSFRSDATQSLDNFHFMMKDLVSIDYRLHVHAGRDLWRRQSCCSASSFLCLRP